MTSGITGAVAIPSCAGPIGGGVVSAPLCCSYDEATPSPIHVPHSAMAKQQRQSAASATADNVRLAAADHILEYSACSSSTLSTPDALRVAYEQLRKGLFKMSSLTLVTLLGMLAAVHMSAAQNSDSYSTIVAKRGGARAFHSYFNVPNAKRLSVAAPYYLYEKRGGGRAFVGGWQPFDGISGRMERRGGGRAFSGWWGPNEYFSRFYENPYYKRSSNLWEFLEDRNGF
ncbi:hypothetical protein RB195_014393 [Necator americanus]